MGSIIFVCSVLYFVKNLFLLENSGFLYLYFKYKINNSLLLQIKWEVLFYICLFGIICLFYIYFIYMFQMYYITKIQY